jgi:YfiH family protein
MLELSGPALARELWHWQARAPGVEVRFTGRGPRLGAPAALARLQTAAPPAAWLRQVHSARVLPAAPGECGEGDALVTRRPGLALAVATADCVPVLLAAPDAAAAVHAGWRGVAAGVVPAAVADLGGDPRRLTAWIGPAIGACCYEVGYEVVASVAARSDAAVATPGPGGRPHLDLVAAARTQLHAAGVGAVHVVLRCTRCDPERLWSYRREGPGVGRNWAFVWLTG